ncbi:MBL fold metallo-hydrolase [Paraherbaspirillum soli]|uniref:MBL fold metallo-hydrolase n=1 Tax=Paraherbaspirillum soli TaxID=631222 RepID=A0ABW0MBA2_9BURK
MSYESKIYKVGDATVTRVSELALTTFTPEMLFQGWHPDVLQDHATWLSPGSMDDARQRALMSVHTWVIQTGRHTILIDTGVGNDKNRPFTPMFDHLQLPYLARLKAAGVEPEAVDFVLLTHLHVDHVGWNTRLVDGNWVPTFPNAKYLFSRDEYQYFADQRNHSERNKTSFIVQQDSVLPIVRAGLAQMIDFDGKEVIDGLTFHPTVGHSFGHASISLNSAGERALFSGDVLHHPIQIHRPEWNSRFDAFPEQARASRRWALDYAADNNAMFFSSHFPETSVGQVTRKDGGFEWRYV